MLARYQKYDKFYIILQLVFYIHILIKFFKCIKNSCIILLYQKLM